MRMLSFEKLMFLYLITGKLHKLEKVMRLAETRNDHSVHYMAALYLGDVREQVKVLRATHNAPIAYLAAKTYGLQVR